MFSRVAYAAGNQDALVSFGFDKLSNWTPELLDLVSRDHAVSRAAVRGDIGPDQLAPGGALHRKLLAHARNEAERGRYDPTGSAFSTLAGEPGHPLEGRFVGRVTDSSDPLSLTTFLRPKMTHENTQIIEPLGSIGNLGGETQLSNIRGEDPMRRVIEALAARGGLHGEMDVLRNHPVVKNYPRLLELAKERNAAYVEAYNKSNPKKQLIINPGEEPAGRIFSSVASFAPKPLPPQYQTPPAEGVKPTVRPRPVVKPTEPKPAPKQETRQPDRPQSPRPGQYGRRPPPAKPRGP